ncbi:MAG: antibiotic biosynthesis monooxygenase [Desulfovibrio sp.]|nr:antibiotic biosynthesis monooxygenase [Desulfovibrio sp.]
MSEIRIVAEMRFKPGQKEILKEAFKALVDDSRAEKGNISYELTEDLKDPDHVFVLETWASQEAIDEHMKTPHFTNFMKLAEGKTAKSEITLLKKTL